MLFYVHIAKGGKYGDTKSKKQTGYENFIKRKEDLPVLREDLLSLMVEISGIEPLTS